VSKPGRFGLRDDDGAVIKVRSHRSQGPPSAVIPLKGTSTAQHRQLQRALGRVPRRHVYVFSTLVDERDPHERGLPMKPLEIVQLPAGCAEPALSGGGGRRATSTPPRSSRITLYGAIGLMGDAQ